MQKTYDYIVVGGGSAGSVLAARLSEIPANNVLLIESGRRDSNPWIHIPATFFKVLDQGRDAIVYAGEPDAGLNGRPTLVRQGHVLGGGSSVNAMIYIRGHADDYNTWSQLGCRNWSYDKVLPVFRELEGNARLGGPYHGTTGPLRVSDHRFVHPLSAAFVQAAQEAGLPFTVDFNGAAQLGAGFYQTTTHAGRRWSAAQAFLREARHRPNLTLMTGRRVARVVFDGKRATAITLDDGTQIGCLQEIALTAGALATPKLLMLSGVGPGEHLRSHGIPVVADLAGVGENYQDHLQVPVQGETHAPISLLGADQGLTGARHMLHYLLTRHGLLTSNIVESGAFADTTGSGQPDIQFHVLPLLAGYIDRAAEPGHGISISPCLLRPRSRGTVKLRSSDPREPALFQANSLADPSDLEVLTRGLELGIRILDQPALQRVLKRRVLPKPGIEADPEALRDYVRAMAKTVYHPAGTCKMGPASDRTAVVGEDLCVRGLEGLRVCDNSIMPRLVSGNTNAPAIMIGERAARFMLGREMLA